jgi:hypothetical protein
VGFSVQVANWIGVVPTFLENFLRLLGNIHKIEYSGCILGSDVLVKTCRQGICI